jgi:4-hydroxybenzoate polyprenyltransferase
MKWSSIIFLLFHYVNNIKSIFSFTSFYKSKLNQNLKTYIKPYFETNLVTQSYHKKNIKLFNQNVLLLKKQNSNTSLYKKSLGFFKLIRYKSLLPTSLLCFTGGWIMNPSIYNLLHSQSFIISVINTLLVMSNSMVINDIYDIEIDKINNPNRPLINGKITRNEAILFSFFLLGISEYLNLHFLPNNMHIITQLANIGIVLYTPVFKRIFILKNIVCAILVSFSLFFSGLASSTSIIEVNHNFPLNIVAMSVIFFGSLSNEILLDIRDYEGDKKMNIPTIPVIFNKDIALFISYSLLNLNIIWNSLSLFYLYNQYVAGLFIFIMMPLLFRMLNIKIKNFSEESIEEYMKDTNKVLFLCLLYFIMFSY